MHESFPKFVQAVLATARLLAYTRDAFIVRKIYLQLSALMESFIRFSQLPSDDGKLRLQKSIEHLADLIEYVGHFQKLNPLAILQAQRALLLFRMSIIHASSDVTPSRQPAAGRKKQASSPLSDSKKKILTFIKQSEQTRAKDIVDEFATLSSRTIRRNLRDLMHSGFIRKKMKDRAVFYTAGE